MAGEIIDSKYLSNPNGAAFQDTPAPLAPAGSSAVIDPSMLGGQVSAPMAFKQDPTSGFADSVKRQIGLTTRTYGPYAAAASAGALMGSEFGPPGMLVGGVAGPALLGLTDLGVTAYNTLGNGIEYFRSPESKAGGRLLPLQMTATEAFDALADKAGLPRPSAGMETFNQNAGRALIGTASTAKTASNLVPYITNPTGKAISQTVAANPGSQMAAAVTGPAAVETARNLGDVQDPWALMGIDLVGGLLGGASASRMSNVSIKTPTNSLLDRFGLSNKQLNPTAGINYENQNAGATIQNARANGVKLTAADVIPDSTSGRIINASRVYGGNQVPAANQTANQVANAVENITESVRPSNVSAGAPNAADRAIAADMKSRYNANKATASTLYNKVDTELAKMPGTEVISLPNTAKRADQLLQDFPEFTQLTGASKSTLKQIEAIGDAAGGRQMSYAEVKQLNSQVGKLVESTRGIPGKEEIHGALKSLYANLQQDIDHWATTTPNKGAAQAYGAAKQFFMENVQPYRENTRIRNVVSSRVGPSDYQANSQNLTQSLLGGGVEDTKLALNLLSPEGKKAFGFKVMETARARGLNEDNAAPFSTQGYVRGLNLGRPDTPTAERLALGGSPSIQAASDTARNIVEGARPSLALANKGQQSTTGKAMLPVATTAAEAAAGTYLANAFGLDPTLGAVTGLLGSPMMARGVNGLLSSELGTDFLLGKRYRPGIGLLVPMPGTQSDKRNN